MRININIWSLGVWPIFSILGISSYIRSSGYNLIGHSILFLPFIPFLIYGLLKKSISEHALKLSRKLISNNALFLLLIILLMFSSIRSISYEFHSFNNFVKQFLLIFILITFIWLYIDSIKASTIDGISQQIWKDLAVSIMIALTLNLFAYFILGIESPRVDTYIGRGVSRISFLDSRAEFPFTHNLRELAQLSGVAFIISYAFLFIKLRQHRITIQSSIALLCLITSLLVIVLADARIILLVTITSTFMLSLFIMLRRTAILIWSFVLISVCFPLFYFLILLYLNNMMNIDILNSSILTLTGRLYVWAFSLQEVFNLDDNQWLFGSGYLSQAVTGISDNYSVLFKNWKDTTLISYHNAFLQTFFDMGIVGILIYLSFFISLVHSYHKLVGKVSKDKTVKGFTAIGLVILLYYLGVGTTEAITPLYYYSLLIIFILLHRYATTLSTGNLMDKPAVEVDRRSFK